MLGRKVLMGRQSAGAGFLRAIAGYGPEKLWCYAGHPVRAKECAEALHKFGSPSTQVPFVHFLDSARLVNAGLLYRPDPVIATDAWRRLQYSKGRAYSICGVTHTTASHPIMNSISGILTAPLEDWDAIICTSVCVRDTIKAVLENQASFLAEKLGATRLSVPQLPVIPLGTHTADFQFTNENRRAARAALQITDGEVVFLYLGRLSHLDKANPAPMYMALQDCARDSRIVLIEAGWFGSDDTERAFKADADKLSPNVRRIFLDGRDPEQRERAWAAADIFTSLSDNIQETFGLTPLEAMAAGLPVVVSDWNGYKETVRDGIDGFRVPTLSMPAGTGQSLADLHELGGYDYHRYCGATSQLVAVDVPFLAEIYGRLIRNPELRKKLGDAGRRRAQAEFDWKFIFKRYVMLWEELEERRRAGPVLYPPLKQRVRPDRMDPFTLFASYPTGAIGPSVRLRRTPSAEVEDAMARASLETTKYAAPLFPPRSLVEELLSEVPETHWVSFEELLSSRSAPAKRRLLGAVVWLCKAGLLRFQLPVRPNASENTGAR